MGDRAGWRPSAKGAQELRRLHKHLGLRRHRWHCGTGLLGKTSDRRDAHRPRSAFHIATVPLCHLLALGRHDATTGRSARGASACSWHVLGGDNKGEVDKVTQAAEHVRVLPQGPLGPPAPRRSRVGPRGARAEQKRAPRAAQAVPGGEALSTKMGDARAEHAPEELVDPAVAWGTLGAHVVTAKGARGE